MIKKFNYSTKLLCFNSETNNLMRCLVFGVLGTVVE